MVATRRSQQGKKPEPETTSTPETSEAKAASPSKSARGKRKAQKQAEEPVKEENNVPSSEETVKEEEKVKLDEAPPPEKKIKTENEDSRDLKTQISNGNEIKKNTTESESKPSVTEAKPVKAEVRRESSKDERKREEDPEVKLEQAISTAFQGDDDDNTPVRAPRKIKEVSSRSCPYLDTINRSILDFDFEKLCSVNLSHQNVYACLVCGKYFQGRGSGTHASTHSVDTSHRVFLNLQTTKFYCLPDNYEIIDSSLSDIQYQLNPTFTKDQVGKMDVETKMSRALHGAEPYRPGVVGLNNIKANDYCNVVLHALSWVPPIRDYFLREEHYRNIKNRPGDKLVALYQRFGELIRKLWNPKAFKSHVSPHEMLQAVVSSSNKRFQITEQGDAVDFLSWLLNSLHLSLNGTKKTSSSIIYKTFRGKMRVFSRKVMPVDTSEESRQRLLLTDEFKEKDEELPFLFLTLDLPPSPLYRDELLENIIPQVPLGVLLQKFNGTTEKEYKTHKENFMKRFELLRLPKFLIFYIKRFVKNAFYTEKNPTIVNFPIMNVDMFDCLAEDARLEVEYTTYDLVSNVVHDGKPDPGQGTYKIQILHRGTGKWFEMEDLHVKEILPQMITLAESYIQVWELNTEKTRDERRAELETPIDGTVPMEVEAAKKE